MAKTRVGVIGVGRWGPNLVRNFHTHPASTVTGVADSDAGRLRLIRERYPEMPVFEEARELIERDDVDAIVICTPTATHAALAARALKAGKHVFVEKPLATTVEECTELLELARKKDRVLFVGHVFVYNAAIQAAAGYIKGGELGRLFHLEVTRTNFGPVRSDVSALWDLASHDLAILRYWLGVMPESVSAVGGKFLGSKVEDAVFATYTFPGGVLANVQVSWLSPKKVREITIVGDKKMLVWDDMDMNRPLQLYDRKISFEGQPASPGVNLVDTIEGFRASVHVGDTFVPQIGPNEPLAAECSAFLRALTEPATSLSTGEDGRAVVEALAATDQSLRAQGRQVRIRYSS